MKFITKLSFVVCSALSLSVWAENDPETGFVIAPGWEIVRANCIACHSAKQVTAQRGTKQSWLESIRWMQKTQGLWKFDSATEETILTYLATNYAPAGGYRRAPIPPSLRPVKNVSTSSEK
jgi:hypothetical protein